MKYPLHKNEDGRWVHTWVRQSSIKTADMCLEKWRTGLWLVVREPLKDASELGTACHAVVEDLLNDQIAGVEWSELDIEQAFDAYWFDVAPTIEVWNNFNVDTGFQEGLRKLHHWYTEVKPLLEPKEVEHTFDIPFIDDDERIVNFTGTVDLVEENMLWDWKFPSRDYARDRWQYDRWDVQSMAYCYALGIPNFSYAIMHPKGVSTMQFERNEQHYEWLRNKVSALCRLLETQTGPYPLGDNGWWCSEKWCENFARCKGATIGGT